MKRSRKITVNGNSNLNLKIAFSIDPKIALTKDETTAILNSITDNIHRSCLDHIPYVKVHTADITIS